MSAATAAAEISRVTFRHLSRLTDDRGILEHAKGRHPRFSFGYCTDDNARLAVTALHDGGQSFGAEILGRIALAFVHDALDETGMVRNRLSFQRVWTDSPSTDDCWGRALWAFGTAARLGFNDHIRREAQRAFDHACLHRGSSLRAMCYAALGAAEVAGIDPHHHDAAFLLHDAAEEVCDLVRADRTWPWPEDRLSYHNALIPEALLVAGEGTGSVDYIETGLDLLEWLLRRETVDNRLSVTPVGGRGPNDPQPAFDQQPIEVAGIAAACARAWSLTNDEHWLDAISLATSWFHGNNDAGLRMIDHESHGGFDGLHPNRVNENQGAESTISMVATLRHERLLRAAH